MWHIGPCLRTVFRRAALRVWPWWGQVPESVKLGGRGEVEHVLDLRHVRDLNAIEDVEAFLHRVDLIAVEICRPLLELGEVFHRAQAALRAVDLLVEDAAKTDGVQPQPTLLGAVVGVQVELAGCVSIDVTIEAGHAEAGVGALAVVRGVEFFLRKRREQEPQAVELHGGEDIFEEPIIVVDRDDFTARDVTELGADLKVDGRWKLGQKRIGKVKVDVEALEPREHGDLHLGKDLTAGRLLGVRKRGVGKSPGAADFFRARCSQALPGDALRQTGGRSDTQRLAARHLGLGIKYRRQVESLVEIPALSFHHAGLGGDVGPHVFFKVFHRFLGVQGIAVEIEAEDLAFLGLIAEGGDEGTA